MKCGLRSHALVVTAVAQVPAPGMPALGTTEAQIQSRLNQGHTTSWRQNFEARPPKPVQDDQGRW